MAENVAPYCTRIPTGMPASGLIDITSATDKAQHITGCGPLWGYCSTFRCTFFDLLKLPTPVADTARGDGGRIRCNKENNHTRDTSQLGTAGLSARPVCKLCQECTRVCLVRTFVPSTFLNALLRYHSNLFCYVSIFSSSLPRLHHHTRQRPCGH